MHLVVYRVNGQKALTESRLIGRRKRVEHVELVFGVGRIDTGALSALKTLLRRAVKPDNGVKATFNERVGLLLLGAGLHELESPLSFNLPVCRLHFFQGFVAAQCFFEQLCLGVAARKVNQNPPLGLLLI